MWESTKCAELSGVPERDEATLKPFGLIGFELVAVTMVAATIGGQEMARIFISYRREDSAASAGRLHDRLREHFGRNNVFMDVDTIEPGLDFGEVIERTVASCDVLIALIGRRWLTNTDVAGQRRLDDPEDLVRWKVATALRRNIRVIPVLIQDTSMPRAAIFCRTIYQPLTRPNALELSDPRISIATWMASLRH